MQSDWNDTVARAEPEIRLHGFVPGSRANGPGLRAVVWVQGCTLGCRECFNPGSHSITGGKTVPISRLFREIVSVEREIEGITISGGEPLQQLLAVTSLLERIHAETCLSVVLFTGYTWDEVQRLNSSIEPFMGVESDSPRDPSGVLRANPIRRAPGSTGDKRRGTQSGFLDCVDVLIAGRYEAGKRIARGLRGSSNKTLHFLSDRYRRAAFDDLPDAEVIVSRGGDVSISGIDPLVMRAS